MKDDSPPPDRMDDRFDKLFPRDLYGRIALGIANRRFMLALGMFAVSFALIALWELSR
jgi:hypothetical protein